MKDKYPRVEPKHRGAWRKWLASHHDSSTGVLLVYVKKPARSIPYADAVEEALCFGWIDSTIYPIDDVRYMQLFTPRKPKSGWSALNKRRVEALVKAGLMTAAGQAKIDVAKASGAWAALDQIESLTLPPAFAAALEKSARARAAFDALPPYARKTYLYFINNVKREETRALRIAEAVEKLIARAKHPRESGFTDTAARASDRSATRATPGKTRPPSRRS